VRRSLYSEESTFIEGPWSFLVKNLLEAISDAKILRVKERLVDKSDLDDLERLHDKNLGPSCNSSPNKASKELH